MKQIYVMKDINDMPWIPFAIMYAITLLITIVWVKLIENKNEHDKNNKDKEQS